MSKFDDLLDILKPTQVWSIMFTSLKVIARYPADCLCEKCNFVHNQSFENESVNPKLSYIKDRNVMKYVGHFLRLTMLVMYSKYV